MTQSPAWNPVQLGMFGVSPALKMHTVAAHERMMADGSTAYVAEHMRWNRTRSNSTPRRVSIQKEVVVLPGQLALFGD